MIDVECYDKNAEQMPLFPGHDKMKKMASLFSSRLPNTREEGLC